MPLIWGIGFEEKPWALTISAMPHKNSGGKNTELFLTCNYPLLNPHQVPDTALNISFVLPHLSLNSCPMWYSYCLHFKVMEG